ncbi:hypothetical protein DPMN_043319 [Dreissena polymorpha]|uniref:Uncharacterized protein n=1 Tax=Dreissena polymorpha TaxID=45954 RepID=A0A9D4D2I9_DREPO|nr:hypothetical protein DPMN_043319 [Dreissena polymorpha]
MQKTREIVEKHIDKAKFKQKSVYDRKAKAAKLEIGDKGLVKILAFKGKHKIAGLFEEELYTVIEQISDNVPVYKVQGEVTKSVKTLYRNHLHLVRINETTGKKELVPDEVENNAEKVSVNKEDSDVTESDDVIEQFAFGDAQKKSEVSDDQVVISTNGHSDNGPNTVIQDNSLTFENVKQLETVESENQDDLQVDERTVVNENVEEVHVIEPSTEERESVQVNDVSELATGVRESVQEQDGSEITKPAPRKSGRVKMCPINIKIFKCIPV